MVSLFFALGTLYVTRAIVAATCLSNRGVAKVAATIALCRLNPGQKATGQKATVIDVDSV